MVAAPVAGALNTPKKLTASAKKLNPKHIEASDLMPTPGMCLAYRAACDRVASCSSSKPTQDLRQNRHRALQHSAPTKSGNARRRRQLPVVVLPTMVRTSASNVVDLAHEA